MQPNTDINALLSGYLWGDCTPEEHAAVEAWIAERDEHRAAVASLRTALQTVERAPLRALDLTAFEQQLAHRLRGTAADAASRPRTKPQSWRGIAGAAVVAMAAIAVVIGLSSRGWRGGSAGTPAANVAFNSPTTTEAGQRATLTLDDGTRIALGPQSQLRTAKDYATSRVVSLVGEAQFDVAHRAAAAPFTVQTPKGLVRVLGTVFSVRSLPDAPKVQVAVTNGRVMVSTGRNAHSLTVAAGGAAQLSDSTVVAVTVDSLQQFTAWSEGQLRFHRAPVSDILATLTRWYGYRFRITDTALVEHNLTADIDADSFKNALNTLKLLLNVDLEFGDKIITLQPRTSRAVRRDKRTPRGTFSTPNSEVGR